MSTRRPHKSRKAPRRPPVTIPPNEVATRDSPYRVVPDINSAEVTTEGSASPPSAHFVQNYLVSILFHAYIAFAPVLLLPILRRTSLFGNWSSNAITALSVFLSNASWMELFNFNCTADAGHAFIAAVQEKRFLASCGSSLAPAKKRRTKAANMSMKKLEAFFVSHPPMLFMPSMHRICEWIFRRMVARWHIGSLRRVDGGATHRSFQLAKSVRRHFAPPSGAVSDGGENG